MSKKNMTLAERRKVLNALSKKVNEKEGNTIMGFASNPEISEMLSIEYIPFPSIKLTNITGGGIPKGKISIVSGESDSGKTSVILEVIGQEMKKNPDFTALWLESENSISQDQLDMFNIDSDRFYYIELEENGAAEDAIDRVDAAMQTGALDLVCINSVKALTPSEEFEKEMSKASIGLQARLLGKAMRKLGAKISRQKVAFIMTNHLSTEIGKMHGDPLSMSGGRAIRYYSLLTLDFRKKTVQDGDPVDKDGYMKIGVSVRKNHCNVRTNPYQRCDYFVQYGKGTDTSGEVIEAAVEDGYLTKAGAWIREYDAEGEIKILPDGKEAKWNGMKAFKAYVDSTPEYFEYLKNKVEGNISGEDMTDEEVKEIIADENRNRDILQEQGVELEDVIESPDKPKKSKAKK